MHASNLCVPGIRFGVARLRLTTPAAVFRADELIPDFERIRVLLAHDGWMHWEPGGIFRTTCDIDITYFPFDVQRCPLLIGE